VVSVHVADELILDGVVITALGQRRTIRDAARASVVIGRERDRSRYGSVFAVAWDRARPQRIILARKSGVRLIGPIIDYVDRHASTSVTLRPSGQQVDQSVRPGVHLVVRVGDRRGHAAAAARPSIVRAKDAIAWQQRRYRRSRTKRPCSAPPVGGAGGHAAAARVEIKPLPTGGEPTGGRTIDCHVSVILRRRRAIPRGCEGGTRQIEMHVDALPTGEPTGGRTIHSQELVITRRRIAMPKGCPVSTFRSWLQQVDALKV
jgi:hypothetical protein